jgi:hypothetical protein
MKNLILFLTAFIFLASCGSKEKPEVKVASTHEVESKVSFSDPARIAGSSFGEFFISMIRTQNYDMALKFTAKGSVKKYGAEVIKAKYQNFDFNYKLTQKSMSVSGDTITLAYTTNEYATGKVKKMTVVVENDTCKLVLPENLGELLK